MIPFQGGRQTKRPEGLQCGLVELNNFLCREAERAGEIPDSLLRTCGSSCSTGADMDWKRVTFMTDWKIVNVLY